MSLSFNEIAVESRVQDLGVITCKLSADDELSWVWLRTDEEGDEHVRVTVQSQKVG